MIVVPNTVTGHHNKPVYLYASFMVNNENDFVVYDLGS